MLLTIESLKQVIKYPITVVTAFIQSHSFISNYFSAFYI